MRYYRHVTREFGNPFNLEISRGVYAYASVCVCVCVCVYVGVCVFVCVCGITSYLVKVKGEDLATPGPLT